MKGGLTILAIAVLAFCLVPSSTTEQAVIFNYTIHVDFFAYSCSLSIGQVSLYDTSGRIVAVTSSPSGGEVAVNLRMASPISTLTATASGLATWDSYYTWVVSGSGTITLDSSGDYWITIRMS
jgi:hypothetical protein